MKIKSIVLIPVVMLALVYTGCGNSSQQDPQKVSPLKKRELEQAIFYVEANLGALGDSGYVQWTPTTAVANLVETMNASQILLPEEEEEYRQAGIRPPKPIPYVIDKPKGAWQVVLIADEAQQKIRVLGYGTDLTEPLVVKEIPCCQF
ncbi:MAG: hypothetical protein AB4426_05325 [Xenococcaceae cyanobacterium]